jgi:hypothetical protein
MKEERATLNLHVDVSTCRARAGVESLLISTSASGRDARRALNHLIDCCSKFAYAGARDDDGVAAAVRFFRDPQEFSAVILAKFDVEMLTFDL